MEMERQASFFLTGGLVATHAEGRDRGAIWDAFQRREVYGTSGPRILLWFDLLNAPGTRGRPVPMGGEATMRDTPIFQARAVGSFEQAPGCPDDAGGALDPERLEHLCRGECYNPTGRRRPITRIDVVRIRPQSRPGEPIDALIEDPWKSHTCDGDPRRLLLHVHRPGVPPASVATPSTTCARTRPKRRGSTRGTCAASATPRAAARASICAARAPTTCAPQRTSRGPGRRRSSSTSIRGGRVVASSASPSR